MSLGTDILEHRRFFRSITRNGGKLRKRLFRPEELRRNPSLLEMAVIFSVKESVAKALGTGFDKNLSWHDITVYRQNGHLCAQLSGSAAELAGDRTLLISASSCETRTATCAVLTERS